jgi:uncharacterized membrane protein
MLKSAACGASRAAVTAICAVIALALAACSEKPATDGGTAPDTASTSAPASSQASLSRQSDSGSAPVGAANLDTSTWLMPPPFYAAGEEPDWRMDIEDGWFSFKRSGLAVIDAPLVQPVREGGADVFATSPIKVTIKRLPCQTADGGKAEFTTVVVLDDTTFEGCAFGGHSSSGSPEAASVIESLGQIDACLKELKQPAIVTAVYPREGERIGVGLRAKDGILYECAVETDGKIAYLDPIEPSAAGAWMNRMRFLRKGVNDAAKCDAAEDVRSGDELLGRLLKPKCKF